jgi:hypothetical protein
MAKADLVGFDVTLRRHRVPSCCSACRPEYPTDPVTRERSSAPSSHQTFRNIEGIPKYPLTDNERTVTDGLLAELPVRSQHMLSFAHYYGVTVATCVVAAPESKGGAQPTVKPTKQDVPIYRSPLSLQPTKIDYRRNGPHHSRSTVTAWALRDSSYDVPNIPNPCPAARLPLVRLHANIYRQQRYGSTRVSCR